ncbi:hypothetical protein [Streptomyces noursei]|uniref:Fibronectin type-III domain-containing protein n=1 Tax=Streptomyces noursei TaxID=1971 RepID=A0A2N8PFR7_STRNR|nr:hypothetical protein [Streptomyces noursei]PNE39856.1 hypothetical protein AOB60_01560 [Streptomyces noursei]
MNANTPKEIRVIFEGGKINPPQNFALDANNTLTWKCPDGSDEQTTYELTYISATDTKIQKASAKSDKVTIPTDLRETRYHVTIRATKDNNYSDTPSPLAITATHASKSEIIAEGLSYPYGMAASGDNLYVAGGSSSGNAKIWKIPTNGDTTKPVRENIAETYAMAAAGDTLYFTQYLAGAVMKMPTDGGTEPVLVIGGRKSPTGVAVVGDSLYIAEKGTGTVVREPIHGLTSVDPVVSGLSSPFGVAAADGILYISENVDHGRVMKAFITGGIPTPVIQDREKPTGLAVADGILYIAEGDSGKVLMIPTAGGTVSTVAEDLNFPTAVTVVNGTLYIAEGKGARVRKVPRLWKLSTQ